MTSRQYVLRQYIMTSQSIKYDVTLMAMLTKNDDLTPEVERFYSIFKILYKHVVGMFSWQIDSEGAISSFEHKLLTIFEIRAHSSMTMRQLILQDHIASRLSYCALKWQIWTLNYRHFLVRHRQFTSSKCDVTTKYMNCLKFCLLIMIPQFIAYPIPSQTCRIKSEAT